MGTIMHLTEKKLIRKSMRKRRRQLSATAQRAAGLALQQQLSTATIFHNSQHIANYISTDGEIDTQPTLQLVWDNSKINYLPLADQKSHRLLRFVEYRDGDPLRRNHFYIPEPLADYRHAISLSELDMLLIPLVAFDRQGNRLGMGGGYYDRTLADLSSHTTSKRPLLIGLAHDFQEMAQLPNDSWDIPLDGVVTNKETLLF